MKAILGLATLMSVAVSTIAHSGTVNFTIVLDEVTGEGQAENVGFFATQFAGATGTGIALVEDTALTYDALVEQSDFIASLIGGTAGTFFQKTIVQDGAAGTLTVMGQLGGLTGVLPGIDSISADDYSFVFSGNPYTSINTPTELETFLTGAQMSGFFEGFLQSSANPTIFYEQRVHFSAAAPVPLPASGLLLVAGLCGLALRRQRRHQRA